RGPPSSCRGCAGGSPWPLMRFRAMTDLPAAASLWQPVHYCVETDTLAIEIRPWPGQADDDGVGRDAGADLVIHYAPDGAPWLWEIEHASRHPEHIAAALAELQRQNAVAA